MNAFVERWKSKSPVFFIRLKKSAIKIGASSASVLVANTTIGLNLSADLMTFLGYVVAACVAIAGTSQLTKE
jgi:hypothetical protein